MAWYSILPPQLIQFESWAVRIFVCPSTPSTPPGGVAPVIRSNLPHLLTLPAPSKQFFLGVLTIVPWAALLLFDAGLYLFRMVLWELPWIGGRARGQQRPRAPSLNERPDGQRRAFGLRGVETDSSDGDHGLRDASVDRLAEKENVAPATDGGAYPSTEGGVKRRAGRT